MFILLLIAGYHFPAFISAGRVEIGFLYRAGLWLPPKAWFDCSLSHHAQPDHEAVIVGKLPLSAMVDIRCTPGLVGFVNVGESGSPGRQYPATRQCVRHVLDCANRTGRRWILHISLLADGLSWRIRLLRVNTLNIPPAETAPQRAVE